MAPKWHLQSKTKNISDFFKKEHEMETIRKKVIIRNPIVLSFT